MRKSGISFLVILIFILVSCSNSYNQVIDNFNKKYFHEEASEDRVYSIYLPDFNCSTMLSDSYELKKGMTLSLIAPDGGVSYKWTALVKDIKEKNKEVETDIAEQKSLSYRVPGVFRDDVVNKLVLTVTDSNGTEYKDTALIIIE